MATVASVQKKKTGRNWNKLELAARELGRQILEPMRSRKAVGSFHGGSPPNEKGLELTESRRP